MRKPKDMSQEDYERMMVRFAIETARGSKMQFVEIKLEDGRHLCIAGFRRKGEPAAEAKRRTIMEYHLGEMLDEDNIHEDPNKAF